MKQVSKLLLVLDIIVVIFIFTYYYYTKEIVGTLLLVFTALFIGMVSIILRTISKQTIQDSSDIPTSKINDGVGELGFFSPHSWVPLWLGLSSTLTMISLIFSIWLFLLVLPIFIYMLVKFIFEYHKKQHL